MPFDFQDLDEHTRRFMVEEIEAAMLAGNIYFCHRLSSGGGEAWVALLRQAAQDHTEQWLAYQLEERGLIRGLEVGASPSRGHAFKHVPHTVAMTLAEGQFNRYYMLGVCRRAVEQHAKAVVVYRAKQVALGGREAEDLDGPRLRPQELIEELRSIESSLDHPLLMSDAGLSVRLPREPKAPGGL